MINNSFILLPSKVFKRCIYVAAMCRSSTFFSSILNIPMGQRPLLYLKVQQQEIPFVTIVPLTPLRLVNIEN